MAKTSGSDSTHRYRNQPWRKVPSFDPNLGAIEDDLRQPGGTSYTRHERTPCCDVRESKSNYIVDFDIPGVDRNDILIEMDENRLTVTAKRHLHASPDEEEYYSEISYGEFQRSFDLPSDVDRQNIEAKLDKGVLTVVLPKAQASRARRIKVS